MELVCTVLDEGLHVLITGGCRIHVGAVSICEYGDDSIQVKTIVRAGHRDNVISEKAALRLCKAFHCTVTVCCGIHYDKIDADGISRVVSCAEQMTEDLKAAGEVTQKQLVQRMQLSQGTVSEMIQKLENKGFVEKKTDSSDKRRILLTLTEEGKKEEQAMRDRNDEDQGQALDCLREEEKNQLADMLTRILESWRKL